VGARTETTLNNTRDFSIGKRLCNLPALRPVGFQANRRGLEVERLSQDCAAGGEAMLQLNRPAEVDGQRAAALRITDLRVLALWHLLVWFRLLPCGFANRDLRAQPRLRLHGMIERIPKSHRYRVTDFGFRAALFFTGPKSTASCTTPNWSRTGAPSFRGMQVPRRRAQGGYLPAAVLLSRHIGDVSCGNCSVEEPQRLSQDQRACLFSEFRKFALACV